MFNDENQYIGGLQDEWGCILIHIAEEYQGFGLGPILGKLAREYYPSKSSGGFTNAGYTNFINVYRDMVKNYIQSGM